MKIKILAENKIAYVDCNLGNIMPNRDNTKGLRIIDFDDAELMSDERLARNRSLTSLSNTERLFAAFKELPDLSARSIELIAWFSPFRDD